MSPEKVTRFENKNRLTKAPQGAKMEYKLSDGTTAKASLVYIKASELESKLAVHPLNPRNQDELSRESVDDIYDKIKEQGIIEGGIAIFNADTGKSELLEGSRRYWCAKDLGIDMPVFKITSPVSDKEIISLIHSVESKKDVSDRERGQSYIKLMDKMGFTSNEELANYLNYSTETVRKRINAAKIDRRLITLFPDYNGIPNAYYPKLSKKEKEIAKAGIDIDTLSEQVAKKVSAIDLPTKEKQAAVLKEITSYSLTPDSNKKQAPVARDIVKFSDKNKKATIKEDPEKRTTTITFKRVDPEIIKEFESFVKEWLK